MKGALKISIVFIAIIATLVILQRIVFVGLTHNRNLKLVDVETSPKNVELLIHGPCEPLWMISPALLDKKTGITSYNLSLSHSDFADNYLHLYWYLKYNSPPRYMLLFVTPESMDLKYNTFNSFRFAPYLSDTVVARVVKENDPDYYQWSRVPLMKFAYYSNRTLFNAVQGYKHKFTGRQNAYYPDGFEPPARRVWGNHAGEFVQLYKENTIFTWDSLREKYLRETIRLGKRHGIKVYLYESPVLTDALSFQINRAQMIEKIQRLAASENVSFTQFQGMKMANERSYFISTLNFNMKGVRLFNDILVGFVREKMVEETTGNSYK